MPTNIDNTNTANSLANWADQIVFHYDGNNNDPDDIAAMPVAALLAAASGNATKTTFLYGNSLTEKTDDRQLELLSDAADFAETLGVSTRNYQDDVKGTTNFLVQILESGQKILAIEGGPMEAIYRALERTDSEFHSNIKLLSHNTWNDNRAEGTTPYASSPRTWDDIGDDFPAVEQIHIRDQNWGTNDDSGFFNRNWDFLDVTTDPVLQAAREAMNAAATARGEPGKENDASDAGMMWFALTGEEDGTAQDVEGYLASAGQFDTPSVPDDAVPDDRPQDPVTDVAADGLNAAPEAANDTAQTGQNQTFLVDVLANDTDADGDALTLLSVSSAEGTTLVSIEENQIKVNPLNAYQDNRVENITYTVSDGNGGTSTAMLQVRIGEGAVDKPDTPDAPDDVPDQSGLYSLDLDESSPLSQATYDPASGELALEFDNGKLLQANGEWGNVRHIDALTIDGAVYDLPIHDDDGPRDADGLYVYNEGTTQNEFFINIGTGGNPADGTLNFGLTDNADGSNQLYKFNMSEQSSKQPDIPAGPVMPDDPVQDYSLSFFVADADSDEIITALFDGAQIEADSLSDATTFFAETSRDDFAFVQISFEDYTTTERVEPYVLFGDQGGDFSEGLDLDAGSYSLLVRAFDAENQILEDQEISFDLI